MNSILDCQLLSDPNRPCVHRYYDVHVESPDQKHIAYHAFDDQIPGPGTLVVAKPDGSDPRTVGRVTWGIGHTGCEAIWIDSHRIAYLEDPMGDEVSTIYDLRDQTTTKAPGLIRSMNECTGHATILPEGRHVNADQLSIRQKLLDWDVHTGKVSEMFDTNQACSLLPYADYVDRSTLNFQNPKWSEDGKRLLVVLSNQWARTKLGLQTSEPLHNLIVLDASSHCLSHLGPIGHHPIWEAQGNGILAYFLKPDQPQDLRRYDLASKHITVVQDPMQGIHVTTDQTDRYLLTDVFDEPKPGMACIRLIDRQSGLSVDLAWGRHVDFDHRTGCHPHPRFSRSGDAVFFNMSDTGLPQLYRLKLPTNPADLFPSNPAS
jgi:hypothetical protein